MGLKRKDKDETWHSHFVPERGALDTANIQGEARQAVEMDCSYS